MEPRKLFILLVALAMALSGCLAIFDDGGEDPAPGPDDGNDDQNPGDGNDDDGAPGDDDDGAGDDGDDADGGNDDGDDPGDGSDDEDSPDEGDDTGDEDGGDEPPAPRVENVSVKNFAFEPENLTVSVNTTVNWTNVDESTGGDLLSQHTVTEENGTFDETLAPGESFEFTFTEPGTYAYKCSFHPTMEATVTVVSEDAGDSGGDAS